MVRRSAGSAMLLALALALSISPVGSTSGLAARLTDAVLIDSFNKVVFGSEYGDGWQSQIVKKYLKPVRFYIHDRSGRGREAERFVKSLPGLIHGLKASVVSRPEEANFHVHIIRRAEYGAVVAGQIYRNRSAGSAPGKCLVRLVTGQLGISRSDAVIVADEGDFLFQRCMVEEILQGLGPVNDDFSLADSVFNDSSRHRSFTLHDRMLLNMLYDPRIRPGMTAEEVQPLLPDVVSRARGLVRRR